MHDLHSTVPTREARARSCRFGLYCTDQASVLPDRAIDRQVGIDDMSQERNNVMMLTFRNAVDAWLCCHVSRNWCAVRQPTTVEIECESRLLAPTASSRKNMASEIACNLPWLPTRVETADHATIRRIHAERVDGNGGKSEEQAYPFPPSSGGRTTRLDTSK